MGISAACRAAVRPVIVGVVLLAATTGCGHDADGPDLAAAPTGVRWQDYQGVAVPVAEQGPTSVSSGVATGFEHSPRGAGLAAINHTIRLSVAPDSQWSGVVNAQVVPGPARDEWAINRVQLSITAAAQVEYAPKLLGYNITEYGAEQSKVDVYTAYSDASRAVNHTTVRWYGDDWRLQLPDPGSTARPIDAIDALPEGIVALEAPK
ncbi:hypothetical protein [Nocardia camponoti]|uniref:DUF8175 domain-containing protein n=1 Tax=Nocardia camponoti TaxID=1616106 RepID=A0A917V5A9_9NOCA|nr:hypothetical protein [Nocardia camponoti]GGK39792.1 hypothetical protein GCM10011591_09340 [Nocardia camponoti]